jgi:hypothetical protein
MTREEFVAAIEALTPTHWVYQQEVHRDQNGNVVKTAGRNIRVGTEAQCQEWAEEFVSNNVEYIRQVLERR